MKTFSITLHLLSIFFLLIYSFSQIDLNLTLFSNPTYQHFQQTLIQLGYFNRPLSTTIFISILLLLSTSYALILYLSLHKKITTDDVIKLSLTTAAILLLSYPAFSHDIFNYIFDARIIVFHNQNPLTQTALDFPWDLWTRFMRWTHRTYPYGPSWLPLTLPFYIAGFGKFIPTLLNFKILGALSYLISVFSLSKIVANQKINQASFTLVLFALNPLIIIESLTTAHLDITMTALMLLGLNLYLNQQKPSSWLLLFISAGTKYVSLSLMPFLYLYSKNKTNFYQTIKLSLITTYALTIFVITQREILPWYFITPFALTALIPQNKFFLILMLGLTPATLLRYTPFLYIGDYTSWVIQTRDTITLVTLSLFLSAYWCYSYFKSNPLSKTKT